MVCDTGAVGVQEGLNVAYHRRHVVLICDDVELDRERVALCESPFQRIEDILVPLVADVDRAEEVERVTLAVRNFPKERTGRVGVIRIAV